MAVYEPSISSVTLTPNPLNINASLFISVGVAEVEVTMYTVSKVAGASYAGQSVSLATHQEEVSS